MDHDDGTYVVYTTVGRNYRSSGTNPSGWEHRFHAQREGARVTTTTTATITAFGQPGVPAPKSSWNFIVGSSTATIQQHILSCAPFLQRGLSYFDVELKAIQLMVGPMGLELPAMLAYVSFPEDWCSQAGLYHHDVVHLETVTLVVDEHVPAVKQAGAIAAKRITIATNKTQNNLERAPDEVTKHSDLAKAAILTELIRWTTKNQARRRQPRWGTENVLTSRYVFTWKRGTDGGRSMKCRFTVHGDKDTAASQRERFSGTSTRWGPRAVVATVVNNQGHRASLDGVYLRGDQGAPRRSTTTGSLSLTTEQNKENLPASHFCTR